MARKPDATHPKANLTAPIRRDFRFNLKGNRINDWHYLGSSTTQLINGLSLMFPIGERFFITSVRHYRDQIDDPKTLAAIKAFIGQEAMHGREHEAYNALLQEAGLPAVELEAEIGRLLGWFQKHTSPRVQLAGTMALEHYTAMLADVLLSEPSTMGDSEKEYVALLRWHALEETEHKAVAMDTWNAVFKPTLGGYLIRTSTMLLATALLMYKSIRFQRKLMKAAGQAEINSVSHVGKWRAYWSFLFGDSPGFLRMVAKPWLDYFRPGFHPWDHDNRHFLAQLEEIETAYLEMMPTAKAA